MNYYLKIWVIYSWKNMVWTVNGMNHKVEMIIFNILIECSCSKHPSG